ncbi:MAG: hypothetical protein ACOX0C_01320 [Patescibacteria group bacterium]|jgi:hypothetical protein
MNQQRSPYQSKNNPEDFSRRQKTALILLTFFSLLILSIWLVQISEGIKGPFKLPRREGATTITEETDLHNRDTDGDGLSDYDEIYVYGTSPYLEDTDGDGISDYDEIMAGTDPLCPEGENCFGLSITIPDEKLDIEENEWLLEAEGQGDFDLATLGPEIIREVLISEGYDQAELDKISDEELLAAYQEALIASEQELKLNN